MSRLELKGITKVFGSVPVLHGIDLTVEEGEFVVFVGPSGCGKSTLLRVIAGLETANTGEITLDGKRVNEVAAADRGLAMVFQSYALYPHMSVRQNLAFGLENSRLPRAEIDARVGEAAQMLQIEPLLTRKPRQLSGGQRQRVAIGRAIVRRPAIFLLDEPLSNLDAELRVVMRAELAALHQRLNATMIYVTHDQVEAMTLADRIVVLRSGRVEQIGSPLDLYNHPTNSFIAGFIGSPRMNFVSGVASGTGDGGTLVEIGGPAPIEVPARLASGHRLTLGVRPQEAAVTSPSASPLAMDVTLVEQLGSETIVHGRTGSGAMFTLTAPGQQALAVGDRVGVDLARAKLHLFDEEGRSLTVQPQ